MPELAPRLKWAFGVALLTALLLPFTLGKLDADDRFGLLLALWVVISGFVNLKQRVQQLQRTADGSVGRATREPCRAAITACCWPTWASRCSSSA